MFNAHPKFKVHLKAKERKIVIYSAKFVYNEPDLTSQQNKNEICTVLSKE